MYDMPVTLNGESSGVQLDVGEQGTMTNEGWSLRPVVHPLKVYFLCQLIKYCSCMLVYVYMQ